MFVFCGVNTYVVMFVCGQCVCVVNACVVNACVVNACVVNNIVNNHLINQPSSTCASLQSTHGQHVNIPGSNGEGPNTIHTPAAVCPTAFTPWSML